MIKKSSPYFAEHRYQPIKIAYLLSPSILFGASSEISSAERTLLLFSQILESFSIQFKCRGFCRLSRIQCYISCFKNIPNEKIIALFHRETFISCLITCKLVKFYLSSLIFRKWLVIFGIKVRPFIP